MSLHVDGESWERTRFGDVVTNINDYFSAERDGTLPYVAGPHIAPGQPSVTSYGSTDDDNFPPTFKRKFRSSDVLLHSRGIEKLAAVDRLGVTGEKLFVLRSMDESRLLQEFLPWLLMGPSAQRHMEDNFTGSVNKFLNWRPLAGFEFDLPPLDQQRRIAALLWAVENHRRSLEQAAIAARQLEAASLEDVTAADWPVRTVAELGDVQLGQQLHPKFRAGAKMRKYLRVANVLDDRLDLDDVAMMDFSDAGAEKFRLREGDILLNEGQSIELVGRCAMFRGEIEDCYMQKTLLRFRAGPSILPEFALAWFRRCYLNGDFSALAARTTSMAHLTAVRFSAMPMPAPPIEAQERLIARSDAAKATSLSLGAEMRSLGAARHALLTEVLGGI